MNPSALARSEGADLIGDRRRRRRLARAQRHGAAHRVLAVRDGALDSALELLHGRCRGQRHGRTDANAARNGRSRRCRHVGEADAAGPAEGEQTRVARRRPHR